MIVLVGIDDTDSIDSRGTNKLAREIARRLRPRLHCHMIVRHQLLFDERIPFTSHNGSAGLLLESHADGAGPINVDGLSEEVASIMRGDFIPGSDPGLCVASLEAVTQSQEALTAWGLRCQREIVTQAEAQAIAQRTGIRLVGLGGTHGGIIGALAAIGLTASGNDGRLVGWHSWDDDLSGPTPIQKLRAREIEVRAVEPRTGQLDPEQSRNTPRFERSDGTELFDGVVDVGKHARPNLRDHRAVLFVTRTPSPTSHDAEWTALKLR